MNPWALLVLLLGTILIIIGVKGSQHNIAAAITGHASPVPAAAGSGSTSTPKGTGPTKTPSGKQIPIVTTPIPD